MSARMGPDMAWSLAAALKQRSLGKHVRTHALSIAIDPGDTGSGYFPVFLPLDVTNCSH